MRMKKVHVLIFVVVMQVASSLELFISRMSTDTSAIKMDQEDSCMCSFLLHPWECICDAQIPCYVLIFMQENCNDI